MSNNKAGQPNRTAPPVTLRNANASLHQQPDNTRSKQRVNEIQQHLLFDVCIDTQLAVHAVCNPQNYQGTWLMLISLAGCIDVTGQTYVSAQLLAKRIGIDRGIARQQLQRLQDSGIVTKVGKQRGRSDMRLIMLPCSHLDIDAGTRADTYAGTRADTYAEIPTATPADTSPHYQIRSMTEQDQQQSDPAAGYSLAEREKFLSQINDGLPKRKQVGLTKRVHQFFDSWADNCVPVSSVIQQLHNEQPHWDSGGGTMAALERITDTQAATLKERQPKPVVNPCTGLDAETVCDTMTHTKLGSNDPVQQCPQRKGTS